jgi:hypothetical protein
MGFFYWQHFLYDVFPTHEAGLTAGVRSFKMLAAFTA